MDGEEDSDGDEDSGERYSVDPHARLLAIASVFSDHIHNFNDNDMGYTKSGSGYCTSYIGAVGIMRKRLP